MVFRDDFVCAVEELSSWKPPILYENGRLPNSSASAVEKTLDCSGFLARAWLRSGGEFRDLFDQLSQTTVTARNVWTGMEEAAGIPGDIAVYATSPIEDTPAVRWHVMIIAIGNDLVSGCCDRACRVVTRSLHYESFWYLRGFRRPPFSRSK